MAAKRKAKTKKTKKRRKVVRKAATPIADEAMLAAGAVVPGTPPPDPTVRSTMVTAVAEKPIPKKRGKVKPRRAASPCRGPSIQSPM